MKMRHRLVGNRRSYKCEHSCQPGREPHNQENMGVDGSKWEWWSPFLAEVGNTQRFLETCNHESLEMSMVTDMTERVKAKSEK